MAIAYSEINDYKNAYKYELIREELELEVYKHNNEFNEKRFQLESKNKLDSLENLKSKQILEAKNLVAIKKTES